MDLVYVDRTYRCCLRLLPVVYGYTVPSGFLPTGFWFYSVTAGVWDYKQCNRHLKYISWVFKSSSLCSVIGDVLDDVLQGSAVALTFFVLRTRASGFPPGQRPASRAAPESKNLENQRARTQPVPFSPPVSKSPRTHIFAKSSPSLLYTPFPTIYGYCPLRFYHPRFPRPSTTSRA